MKKLAIVLAVVCVAWAPAAATPSQPTAALATPLPLAYTNHYVYCPDFYTGECLNPGTRIVTPGVWSPGTSDSSPTWSPDADEIALARAGDIVVMNATTGALVNITNTASGEWSPAWSPDGQRIAFWSDRSRQAEVYVMDPDGSNVVHVTTVSGTQTGSRLSWSPGSTRLAYVCAVEIGNDDVCTINIDGTGFLRLTTDSSRDVSPAWSPDGGAIAFATNRNGDFQLARMSPDGSGEALIGGGVSGWDPAWSPDGRQIAFTAVDSGLFGIGVSTMRADGSGVSVVVSDASEPAWVPISPFASFSVVCSAMTCTVDATVSTGNITAYAWDFGDQTTGTGGVVSHTYTVGGNFTITLTVTDDGGATSTSQESVFLNQPAVAAFTVTCNGPTCTFDASASSDPDGPIQGRYVWNFGDGSDELTAPQIVTHTYPNGTFQATLVIVGDGPNSTIAEATLTIVNASPVAAFTATCAGLTCTFNASASTDADDGIWGYTWGFGDGSFLGSSTAVVTRGYQVAGTYLVTLKVVDRAGQEATFAQNVTVTAPPPVVPMHVGDLDGSATSHQNTWTATATVEIHRGDHQPLSGVTVSGTWNGGTAATCTTNAAGRCVFSRTGIGNKTNSVTFTVTSAVRATFTYASSANHDPESDSNGTAITVRRR